MLGGSEICFGIDLDPKITPLEVKTSKTFPFSFQFSILNLQIPNLQIPNFQIMNFQILNYLIPNFKIRNIQIPKF